MQRRFANLSPEQSEKLDAARLRSYCSIARAAELIADAWTVLLVRELFWGSRRYDELQQRTGIASNVLASRLKKLLAAQVIDKVAAPEDARRFDYSLTESGRELFPVLMAVMAWGDKHAAGPHGPMIELRHSTCGERTQAGLRCSHCGEVMSEADLVTELNLSYLS